MRRPIVPEALCKEPFTAVQAAAHGVTGDMLRSAPWRQIFHQVWVHADLEDTLALRLAAIRLVLPRHAVVCGLTAAWLHGVDVRRQGDLDLHVSFAKGRRIRNRAGLAVCQETLEADDIMTIDGLHVTTPLRTTFDCLRWLRGWERVVVADALTHAELVTVMEIRRYFAGKRRLRNLRIGERLVDDIEPLTESPMESRSRMLLIDGGLPRPKPQHELRDVFGKFVARLDLAYLELKVAVEYDGADHWLQRRKDDRRRDAARRLGWVVIVFSADDVYKTPEATVALVRAELRARATMLSVT
jgi:hypothetical protein